MSFADVSDWLFDGRREDAVDDDRPETVERLLDEIGAEFGVAGAEGWAALGDHLENENFHRLAQGARARARALGWVEPELPPPNLRERLARLLSVREGAAMVAAVFGGAAATKLDAGGFAIEPLFALAAAPTVLFALWLYFDVSERRGYRWDVQPARRSRVAWIATVGAALVQLLVVVTMSPPALSWQRGALVGAALLALALLGPSLFRRS